MKAESCMKIHERMEVEAKTTKELKQGTEIIVIHLGIGYWPGPLRILRTYMPGPLRLLKTYLPSLSFWQRTNHLQCAGWPALWPWFNQHFKRKSIQVSPYLV